eukprot:TRINITY_DN15190_c0_g1_i1.p1 TRINITY_DN15190_c0_g1~~TRINITY_DN15190_c0_g1_i1.p1  ORF type:complete len:760 (-),score=70.80 TRINITY_DN15190_c0_g1_i1:12-2291(-)
MSSVPYLLLFLLIICKSAQADQNFYLSSRYGTDASSTCSSCEPCQSMRRIQDIWKIEEENVTINLMPGEYSFWSSSNTSVNGTNISIRGIPYLPCINGTGAITKLIGDFSAINGTSFDTVSISNVLWVAAPDSGQQISISAKIKRSLHLDTLEMLSDALVAIKDSCETGINNSITFAAASCRIHKKLTLSSCLSDIKIDKSSFLGGGLVAYNGSCGLDWNGHTGVWNLSVINSSFLNGSAIYIELYNTIIRGSRFYAASPRDEASLWEQSVIRLSSSACYPDARGNFWGHQSGPFSCCNVDSPGVYAVDADTSSWCLDEECSTTSAPFQNNTDSGYNFREDPPACQHESYCPRAGNSIPIGVGVGLFLVLSACISVALIDRHKNRNYLDLDNPEAPATSHRTLLFFDAASIVVAVFFTVYAFFPIIYPQERQTNISAASQTWYIFFGGLVTFSRALRIAAAIWNIVILKKSSLEYPSMLAQIIFSAFALQFTFALRFSEVVTDPLSIFAFLHVQEHLLPEYQPLGTVIAVAKANWIYFLLLALSDLVLAVPQIIWSLKIVRKRDFHEVENLKRQLSHNPLVQSAPQAPQIRKAATVISWFFLADAILFLLVTISLSLVYGFFVFAVALTRGPLTPSFAVSGLSRLFFLGGCVIIQSFGFFLFRWKFFESSWIMNYIALSIGLAASLLQFGAYYFFALDSPGSLFKSPEYAWGVLGGSIFLAILLIIPTVLAYRLVRRMRLELAAAFTSSVYRQLEDTLN